MRGGCRRPQTWGKTDGFRTAPGGAEFSRAAQISDPRALHEAPGREVFAHEQDVVAGRIRFVPLKLFRGNFDYRSDVDVRSTERRVRTIIGDRGVGFAIPDVDLIGPIGVCDIAAA